MLLETKANDIFEEAMVYAWPTMNEENRKSVFDHLKKRQKRRHPLEQPGVMPDDVWEKFRENFEKAGNQKEWLKTRSL